MKAFLFIAGSFFFLFFFVSGCTSDDDESVIEIVLYQNSVVVERNKEVTIGIMQGNGGYEAEPDDEEIATATTEGNTVTVRGEFVGRTFITIKDNRDKTASLAVNVPGTPLTTEDRFFLADPGYNEAENPTTHFGITYKRTEEDRVVFYGNVLELANITEYNSINAAEILEKQGEVLYEFEPADFFVERPEEGSSLNPNKYYIVKDDDMIRLIRISALTFEEDNYFATLSEKHRKETEDEQE